MSSVHATIASHPFDLSGDEVERAMQGTAAEPIRTHYVVVGGRRYPPKQVIATVTGLDRSAFISTQARSVLERLGFTVGRVGSQPRAADQPAPASPADERLAREAALLRPFIGDFVAVNADWTEVIASGPDPYAVKRALDATGRRGAIFQVPRHPDHDVGGFDW
ncbi:MAG TPA: hypothetical protein VGO60_18720 [Iamia sp.]|jgi:hypothetical protein|nr:hypothetical protein [Iamia sp.]